MASRFVKQLLPRLGLVWCLVSGAINASADVKALELLVLDLPSEALSEQTRLATSHVLNGEFELAIRKSAEMVNAEITPVSSELLARLQINHGLFHLAMGDQAEGSAWVERGFNQLIKHVGELDRSLMRAHMARGYSRYAAGDWEAARENFHVAQNIVHRNQGVFSVDQQDILYFLTMIELNLGNLDNADRTQLFSLMVDEQAYGYSSPELIPLLVRLGTYFAARGNMLRPVGLGEIRPMHSFLGPRMCRLITPDPRVVVWTECFPGLDKWQRGQMNASREASEILTEREKLFDTSLEMYERAVAIQKQYPSHGDTSLVETMTSMADAYIKKGKSRGALQLLREAAAVDETHGPADTERRVRSLVGLGDLLLLQSESQAFDVYLKASRLLEDLPQQSDSDSFFAAPVRLRPDSFQALAALEADGHEDKEYFAILSYDVSTRGRVENIKVLEDNMPGAVLRSLRLELKKARFRPRILDGELARTEDRRIRFAFKADAG